MTQYLTGHPFTVPVCSKKMSTEEYFLKVGALKWCDGCNKNVAITHKHVEGRCPTKGSKEKSSKLGSTAS